MDALFPTYQRWDITVASAEGSFITDIEGKKYLDFVSGIAVCNLGHRHPKVQKAVEEQLENFWHVSNLFQIDLQEQVAEKLIQHCDGDAVFFCNSGAEANEAAIKLARKHTGKSKIITFLQSFHGRTFATMSATGQSKIHTGFGPLLKTFVYLSFNDQEQLEKEMDDSVAAVMVEVVQGEGGVIPASKTFMKKIEDLCKRHNALLIIDEVQTGIGRTGKPFAYQHYGITPHIITTAKGLGSGFPIGAMIGKAELKESFGPGSHGSTFGGNPVALAAAHATLDIIFDEEFLQGVSEKGDYLLQQLKDSLKGNEFVKDIRGKGLMIGIECNGEVAHIIKKMQESGLLALTAGPKVIRLLPPLTVNKKEIDQAVSILALALAQTAKVEA
jgi:acetylornithine/N-succinyldiaminopimelate aminotransferase